MWVSQLNLNSTELTLSLHSPTTGELPLEVIRMKAKGCKVNLSHNDPGFTLPSNIGKLGDDIVTLNLSNCSLRGAWMGVPTHPRNALAFARS